MINNFGEIVSSLLTADHTCRRSEDESYYYLELKEILTTKFKKFRSHNVSGSLLDEVSKKQIHQVNDIFTILKS